MSNNWEQNKIDFASLVNLWDKALESGVFNDVKKDDKTSQDFFGNTHFEDAKEINQNDAEYWDKVIGKSAEVFPDETTVLMEAARKKETENKKGLGDLKGDKFSGKDRVKTTLEKEGSKATEKGKAKILANTPNFVKPDTVGSDTTDKEGKPRVTAGLAADAKFSSLEKLKLKLYDLEVKMSGKNGLDDKKAKSLEKQFSKILGQIEKISNSFGGSYKDSEYYS